MARTQVCEKPALGGQLYLMNTFQIRLPPVLALLALLKVMYTLVPLACDRLAKRDRG